MNVLFFSLGTERLDELVSTVMQRVDVNDGERPTILVCFMLLSFLCLLWEYDMCSLSRWLFPPFYSMRTMKAIRLFLQLILILVRLSAVLGLQERRWRYLLLLAFSLTFEFASNTKPLCISGFEVAFGFWQFNQSKKSKSLYSYYTEKQCYFCKLCYFCKCTCYSKRWHVSVLKALQTLMYCLFGGTKKAIIALYELKSTYCLLKAHYN